MPGTRPHHFLRSTEQVIDLIADTRELTARSIELLRSHPKPDTFTGRRTQQPFPQEDSLLDEH
jgi:hypothetical protein